MKNFLTTLFSVISLIAVGQNSSEFLHCGYDWVINQHEKENPGYKSYLEKSFQLLKNEAQFEKTDFNYNVQTVVHIVYQNDSQNLSDERVQAVINQLNRDFSRSNADTTNIRPIFKNRAADPAIHFELQEIIRVATDTVFELDIFGGGLPDNVKSSADGGSDARNVDEFLNIWICNIEDRILLGYAYPPSCAPNWPEDSAVPERRFDGVVVHYEAFDTTGSISTQGTTVNFQGRVLTHEVGHYLGLRHTWGDGTLAIFGFPDCDADDGLEDTPNQGLSSNFSCDFELNTCTEGETDLPDMIENYMDYSAERCQNMFTVQQVGIMRATLSQCRNNILTSSTEVVRTEEIGFQLYPNPTSKWLNLDTQTDLNSHVHLRIIGLNGHIHIEQSIGMHSGQARSDISSLQPGLYFAEFKSQISVRY